MGGWFLLSELYHEDGLGEIINRLSDMSRAIDKWQGCFAENHRFNRSHVWDYARSKQYVPVNWLWISFGTASKPEAHDGG